MQIPRRGPRRRTLFLVSLLALVALLTVATFGSAAGKALTPRNDPGIAQNKKLGEIYASNVANDCLTHHKGEGMKDAVIVYPVIPAQIQLGQSTKIPVQIINPWKQKLQEMSMEVKLLGDQVLTVKGTAAGAQSAAQDRYYSWSGPLGRPADSPAGNTARQGPPNVTLPFQVEQGASMLVASLEIHSKNATQFTPGVQTQDEFKNGWHFLTGSTGPTEWFTANGSHAASYYEHRYLLKGKMIVPLEGSGPSAFELRHSSGYSEQYVYYLNATVVMTGGGGGEAGKTYSVPIPKDVVVDIGQAPYTAFIEVVPFAKGTQKMEIKVRSGVYYKHQDGVTPSIDYYSRVANLSEAEDQTTGSSIIPARYVVVGDTEIASPFAPAGQAVVQSQWQLVLGETSGFGAAGLLLPSLLLGGTYGKASRRFFNTLLGGAKRRVMFHNLSSLGLSLVAFVHILLFTTEIRYTILMGVLWGGLASLSLLVLGLTGYYQVPLIQRHGYKWWRYTHLVFGLLVVVFVGYHMVADGPDFFFIKQEIPKWINEINLAQK